MPAYELLSGTAVGLHCQTFGSCHSRFRLPGSSRGRGTRAAGWFQDLLDDRQVSGMTSAILLNGVTGWARAGEEYTGLMEGYDPEKWSNAN